jgi:hypothetical protein
MALARIMSAMERFSFMSDAQRKNVLRKASAVNSRHEMTQLVDSIASGDLGNSRKSTEVSTRWRTLLKL